MVSASVVRESKLACNRQGKSGCTSTGSFLKFALRRSTPHDVDDPGVLPALAHCVAVVSRSFCAPTHQHPSARDRSMRVLVASHENADHNHVLVTQTVLSIARVARAVVVVSASVQRAVGEASAAAIVHSVHRPRRRHVIAMPRCTLSPFYIQLQSQSQSHFNILNIDFNSHSTLDDDSYATAS